MGTLRGFDDFVNMVLDDVTEYEIDADGTKRKIQLDQVRIEVFGPCLRPSFHRPSHFGPYAIGTCQFRRESRAIISNRELAWVTCYER